MSRPRRVYDTAKWRRIRLEVLARDNHQCTVRCTAKCERRATAVDHRIPVSEGGAPYDKTNLRAICRPCNTALRNERRAALARRLLSEPDPQPRTAKRRSATWPPPAPKPPAPAMSIGAGTTQVTDLEF